MALIPVTLAVGFTSNHPGAHRICYRLGPSGPYDCSNSVVCLGGGAPCSLNIVFNIDNETCDSYDYEGYVQAECEDINSLIGRVPFTASITPVAPCDARTVICTGEIQAVNLITVGTGYNAGAPAVTVTGGGGVGAVITAVMTGTDVTGLTVVNAGSGYTSLPTITIDPSPTGGGNATAEVISLTDCGTINLTDCDGNILALAKGILGVNTNNNPATSKIFCIETGSVFNTAPEYVVTAEGCCYDCTTYEVTAGPSGGSFNYQKCTGEYIEGAAQAPGTVTIDCMITGSIFITAGNTTANYGYTITSVGPCS